MQYFLLVCLISVAIHLSVAPPVNQKTNNGEQDEENEVQVTEEVEMDMEYRRYLMEVVQALESDPEFRTKLEQAHEEDIRTGRIAEQLEFVNHNVRTKLDELKREELERLRHLATRENELRNGLDIDHLDHTNTRTFEIQDLKKLIAKTTKDLALADERRREEFKNHEMEKQFQEQEKLKHMSDAEKQKYEEELQALKEKQKKHQPIHHPGSKHQLEEVWEKEDHMETEEFNPRTFFYFHDIDGNGVWDQDEVKALFLKELDKLYALGTSQDDMLKRVEEMERMREHVFNEADLNKDGLISYEEFLKQTKKPEFQRDEGWQSLDEQQIYTPEEYEQYQKQTQMLANAGIHPNQASGGVVDPSYGHVPVAPGAVPPQVDPNHQQYQGQIHPQYYQQPQVINQQQFHNQIPQQPQQPQQQYHPNLSQQQFHGQMPPNQPYQHMQMPQGQVPVEQLHPVPHQGQVQQNPPVPQLHQGQVQQNLPVPQLHQGQVQQNPPVLQQPAQVPVEHNQQQAPNFQQQQNVVNQVPQNVQSNEVPQHKSPSQLNIKSAQPAVQQNKI